MLSELEIENLAVIAHVRIPFSNALNVFTGETGAGKSILIHGIQAILGLRVTKDLVRTGCKKAVVNALFRKLSPAVCARLDALSIDHEEDELLLTREILADGGSVARINGHVTTIAVLREVGEVLINIHGQHDNQVLMSPENHLQLLDEFGGDSSYLEAYQEEFRALQSTARKLNQLQKREQERVYRQRYLEDLVEEVEQVNPVIGEEDELEETFSVMQHAEEIVSALQNTVEFLDGLEAEETAVTLINHAQQELSGYSDLRRDFGELVERLKGVSIEVTDIAEECKSLKEMVDLEPQQYHKVQDRLQQIRRLAKQYNTDGDGLAELCMDAKKELQQMQDDSSEIRVLKQQKKELLESVSEKAKKLSEFRKTVVERFVREVTAQLEFLNMPNVVLVGKQETGKLTIHGMDSLEFLISANHGEEPKPMAKIASGGELSRIMLAIKCVIADMDSIPTLIFDEIDTGVSGKAAQKIGMKLREVAKSRQVLCVTHLSQIAVMGQHHLYIEKQTLDGRTETHVTVLNDAGRVAEIARIMGGENPSELMLQSAGAELKRWAEYFQTEVEA